MSNTTLLPEGIPRQCPPAVEIEWSWSRARQIIDGHGVGGAEGDCPCGQPWNRENCPYFKPAILYLSNNEQPGSGPQTVAVHRPSIRLDFARPGRRADTEVLPRLPIRSHRASRRRSAIVDGRVVS